MNFYELLLPVRDTCIVQVLPDISEAGDGVALEEDGGECPPAHADDALDALARSLVLALNHYFFSDDLVVHLDLGIQERQLGK